MTYVVAYELCIKECALINTIDQSRWEAVHVADTVSFAVGVPVVFPKVEVLH